jgi:pyruvate formate lyase activating enzyme
MAKCRLCDDTSSDNSKVLGVCLACIRQRPQEALEIAGHAHRKCRAEFGLPAIPPDDPNGVRCNLCVNICKIGENKISYCGLRKNLKGRLTGASAAKAKISWYHDPLPTNCVADWVCAGGTGAGYPTYAHCKGAESGYKNLAAFFQACSFNCLFCQNWHFRNETFSSPTKTIEDLVRGVDSQTSCICYFGGDPSPQLPFSIKASRTACDKNKAEILRICWETNGSMNPKWLDEMMELAVGSGGCVKFDLKAWDNNLHLALTGVENQRTLDNFARAASYISRRPNPPVLIANTLMVTGYVDAAEVAAIARFIAALDPDIPYSLLAFHPQFYMSDLPLTSRELAEQCRQAAMDAGLKKVRIGNMHLLT